MWIALATPNRLAFPLLDFIFQYLWDTKQQIKFLALILVSCELLSFFSIFGIQNNNASGKVKSSVVVNCFHFSVSLGYKTTFVKFLRKFLVLWIAFIFQYLWDTKQPCNQLQVILVRCELLSFFSIFGIQNNLMSLFFDYLALWIALATPNRLAFPLLDFIFQYLWDTKQPV